MRVRSAFLTALAFAGVWLWWRAAAKAPPFRHVFINQTPEHRFDESIRGSILAAYMRTHVQNAVVITTNVHERDLSAEAARMFKRLRLGESNKGRAILYLYNPEEHALKIEVGYELEGALPDLEVKFLERAAKSFFFAGRMQDFWAELINTLNIEIAQRESGEPRDSEGFDFAKMKYFSGGAGSMSGDYMATAAQLALEMRRLPPAQESRFKPSPELRVSIQAYLQSLHDGFGEADLPLLSDESRVFRRFTPQTSFQLFRNWRMMDRAGIDQIFIDGDLGFVFFHQGNPVLPLVFRKSPFGWKAVEPMSWALFIRYENSPRVYLKFPLAGLSAGVADYIAKNLGSPVFEAPEIDPHAIDKIGPGTPLRYYQWRLYWPEKATEAFERAAGHDDEDIWVALDAYLDQGRISPFVNLWGELARRNPGDQVIERNYQFYRKLAEFPANEWQLD